MNASPSRPGSYSSDLVRPFRGARRPHPEWPSRPSGSSLFSVLLGLRPADHLTVKQYYHYKPYPLTLQVEC
eukprot:354013-Chlamydomonas_euryale.AAC.2